VSVDKYRYFVYEDHSSYGVFRIPNNCDKEVRSQFMYMYTNTPDKVRVWLESWRLPVILGNNLAKEISEDDAFLELI